MYKPVETNLNFVDREKEVLAFWKEENIFEKSVKKNEGNPEFSFYDGPPTANGKPHIGHILTRVMKDIIPRYKTMKGYHVLRKAGWDTHGLPVELEVEKQLGIDGKQEIEKYGIEPFIKKCKESVWKYTDEWQKMSDRIGYWADMKTRISPTTTITSSRCGGQSNRWQTRGLSTKATKSCLIALVAEPRSLRTKLRKATKTSRKLPYSSNSSSKASTTPIFLPGRRLLGRSRPTSRFA